MTRTAMITGASAGIGEAFAKEFAHHGFDLVLVARRRTKLETLADAIRTAHKVSVHVIAVDLADEKAGAAIEQELEGQQINIDALVNNAGYALNDGILDSSWPEHLAMHQVMLTSYLELCRRLLPGMVSRGYGRIINVSSLSAFVPAIPGSLYSAIKRYLVDMSLAIDFDLRDKGIHCCAVCPGFTYSEFHDVMGVREQVSAYPPIMWQSAEQVAREGYDAVMKGQVVIINGWVNRAIAALVGLLPRPLQYRIGRNTRLFEE